MSIYNIKKNDQQILLTKRYLNNNVFGKQGSQLEDNFIENPFGSTLA